MNWNKLFTDADGDVNLAEIIAALGGLGAVITPLHAYFAHGTAFDIQNYGIGLGAVIGALGAAQRLRGDADRK